MFANIAIFAVGFITGVVVLLYVAAAVAGMDEQMDDVDTERL